MTSRTPSPDRRNGFTLVELLVVIGILALLAALLFPVFAAARAKGRQAACLSNLRQAGSALALYVQDYDGRMPDCCGPGRGPMDPPQRPGPMACPQAGISRTASNDAVLGPEQTPPRYIQELLHPYVKNAGIWFCPAVDRRRPETFFTRWGGGYTYGYNGTTYFWIHAAYPWKRKTVYRDAVRVSGMQVAAIPRPAEAPTLWDMPFDLPLTPPCTELFAHDLPPHTVGLNVLYADGHAKLSRFHNRPTVNFGPSADECMCCELWAVEHHWEGYFETP